MSAVALLRSRQGPATEPGVDPRPARSVDLIYAQQYVACSGAAYEGQPQPVGREARARPRREPLRIERRDEARPILGHQDRRRGRGGPPQDAVQYHRDGSQPLEPPGRADECIGAEQQTVQREPPYDKQPRGLRREDDDSRGCVR